MSDRKAKNLPQLYLGCKGINTLHEVKQSTDFDAVQAKAIAKCLDEFCGRLQDSDNSDKYQYQQVIFKWTILLFITTYKPITMNL